MKILIAGGTGFVGQALVKRWHNIHTLTILGRSAQKISALFGNTVKTLTWDKLTATSLEDIDLIINLTGDNIGAGRWTDHRRKIILDSRVQSTKQLAQLCASLGKESPWLFNTSAIGTYGLQESKPQGLPPAMDETFEIDFNAFPDFLSEVGRQWEKATDIARSSGVRVVIMRFGVVLGNGGVLSTLKLPFLLGLGGKIATGQQPFCWISLTDLVRAIEFLMENKNIDGPINLVSPKTVTQEDFAKTLGKALHRPTFLWTPSFLLKLLMGKMAEELILKGQHIFPKRLLDAGFQFELPDLEATLKSIFSDKSAKL